MSPQLVGENGDMTENAREKSVRSLRFIQGTDDCLVVRDKVDGSRQNVSAEIIKRFFDGEELSEHGAALLKTLLLVCTGNEPNRFLILEKHAGKASVACVRNNCDRYGEIREELMHGYRMRQNFL
jgi:hypothetical protein